MNMAVGYIVKVVIRRLHIFAMLHMTTFSLTMNVNVVGVAGLFCPFGMKILLWKT